MNTRRQIPGQVFDGLFCVETIAAIEAAVHTVLKCYDGKESGQDRETADALGESASALKLAQDRWHAFEKAQRTAP